MDTPRSYHARRIHEIQERINVLSNYIGNSSAVLKHAESSVGQSYKKRRNSRNRANSDYRISEFTSEIKQLEINLRLHQQRLAEL